MILPFENDTNATVKKLAKRSLQSEKRRNTMVIIAIVLSAFLMAMCGIVAISLTQVKKNLSKDTYEAVYTSITKEEISALTKRPEIDRVGSYYWLGDFTGKQGYTISVIYLDEPMLSAGRTQVQLMEGMLPTKLNEIAIDKRFLEKYASGASIGDTILLNLQEKQEFTITAILSSIDTGTDDFVFLISEEFLKASPTFQPSEYHAYVHFKDVNAIADDRLKTIIATIGEELNLNHIALNSLYFSRNTDISVENFLVIIVLAVLILFGGSIVIQSIFRISINEKIQDYGQLRTLGATQKQIKNIVRREGRRLACIGIPIGVTLGILSGTLLMSDTIAGGFHITNVVIVAVIIPVICLLLVRFSIRKPVKIAASTSAIEAIRFFPFQNLIVRKSRKHHRISPFRLALTNFSRDKKKTVSTLLSLIFGGFLLLLSASLFTSYSPEKNARLAFPKGNFKLYINSDNKDTSEIIKEENPLTELLRQEVLGIDGVKDVITTRNSVGGTEFSIDTKNFSGVGMCDIITPEDTAFIKQNLVRGHMTQKEEEVLLAGVSYFDDIEPGDILQIQFDCSDSSFLVPVAGFFDSSKIGKGNGKLGMDSAQVLITDGFARKLMPNTENLSYTWEIVTDPTKDSEIQVKLEELVTTSSTLSMFTWKEEIKTWEVQWNVMTGGMQGISWLIFLFGIINLINMTLSNQLSRKKESSIMRSVGLTKKQLYQMLIIEGLLFIFFSILFMLVLGIPVSVILCNQLGKIMYGQSMDYQFPFLQIGIYLLVLLVLEFILSKWSIQNSNKHSLVEQLRTIEW